MARIVQAGCRRHQHAPGDQRWPPFFSAAVTSKGTAQFIGLTDTLTPMRHLSFLRALTNSLRGPVYLVVSPVALHEDAQVLSVLERNKDRLRLIALPVWLRCGG